MNRSFERGSVDVHPTVDMEQLMRGNLNRTRAVSNRNIRMKYVKVNVTCEDLQVLISAGTII